MIRNIESLFVYRFIAYFFRDANLLKLGDEIKANVLPLLTTNKSKSQNNSEQIISTFDAIKPIHELQQKKDN